MEQHNELSDRINADRVRQIEERADGLQARLEKIKAKETDLNAASALFLLIGGVLVLVDHVQGGTGTGALLGFWLISAVIVAQFVYGLMMGYRKSTIKFAILIPFSVIAILLQAAQMVLSAR